MTNFISNLQKFESLLLKVNINKKNETAGLNDIELDANNLNIAEQVKFKNNWELLVCYLSQCFVCGFENIDSKNKFQEEFLNLILKTKNRVKLDSNYLIEKKIFKNSEKIFLNNQTKLNEKINNSNYKTNSFYHDLVDKTKIKFNDKLNDVNYDKINSKKDEKNFRANSLNKNLNNDIIFIKNVPTKNKTQESEKKLEKKNLELKNDVQLKKENFNEVFNKKIKQVNNIIDKKNEEVQAFGKNIKINVSTNLVKDLKQIDLTEIEKIKNLNKNYKPIITSKNELIKLSTTTGKSLTENDNNEIDETHKSHNLSLKKNESFENNLLKGLINLVYQSSGIQKQLNEQIKSIKYDLLNEKKPAIFGFNLVLDYKFKKISNEKKLSDDYLKKPFCRNRKLENAHNSTIENILFNYFNLEKSYLIKKHESLSIEINDLMNERGIFTKTELNDLIDSSVIIELPFITWLNPDNLESYCYKCFDKIKTSKVFCSNCNTVNYCSEKCSTLDFNHFFFCDNIKLFNKFGIFFMAIQLLFSELISLDIILNYDFTNDFFSTNLLEKLSSFDTFEKNSDNLKSTLKKNLDDFYSLESNIESFSFEVLICFCLASIFISKFLHLIYDFDFFDSENIIATKLFQIALIIKQNTMEIYDESVCSINFIPIGHGLYLNSSLLNHGCKPNCTRFFEKNKLFVFKNPKETIKSNSELTISYGLNYELTKKERRKQLKERFGFDCLCIDCTTK